MEYLKRKPPLMSFTSPIEPTFHDSNTSEFDEDFAGDSRQDTSLDCTHDNLRPQGQQSYGNQIAPLDSNHQSVTSGGALSSNEQVLDSDLRQANRLNLELALLQNVNGNNNNNNNATTADQSSQASSAPGGSRRFVHTKSLASGGGLPSVGRHQHFPQSGVLAPASGHSQALIAQEQQQQQQAFFSKIGRAHV